MKKWGHIWWLLLGPCALQCFFLNSISHVWTVNDGDWSLFLLRLVNQFKHISRHSFTLWNCSFNILHLGFVEIILNSFYFHSICLFSPIISSITLSKRSFYLLKKSGISFGAAAYFVPYNKHRKDQHRICKGFLEGELWNNGPSTRQLHSLFWP